MEGGEKEIRALHQRLLMAWNDQDAEAFADRNAVQSLVAADGPDGS